MSPPNSNEVLVKEKIVPKYDHNGKIVWVGDGRNTLKTHQIRKHFDQLNIDADWPRVSKIQSFRNNIEHYYSDETGKSMQTLIANSFIVIRDFIANSLNLDPKDTLGEYAWDTLISVNEVYDQEKMECVKVLESIDFSTDILATALHSYNCSECGSDLISIRELKEDMYANVFYCRACDKEWSFENIAENSILEYFHNETYWASRDGDEPFIVFCPECGLETYLGTENVCPVCETSLERSCQRCTHWIPSNELDDSGYCGWCSHKISKGE